VAGYRKDCSFCNQKEPKTFGDEKTRFHWHSTKLPSPVGAQTLLVPKPPPDSNYKNEESYVLDYLALAIFLKMLSLQLVICNFIHDVF